MIVHPVLWGIVPITSRTNMWVRQCISFGIECDGASAQKRIDSRSTRFWWLGRFLYGFLLSLLPIPPWQVALHFSCNRIFTDFFGVRLKVVACPWSVAILLRGKMGKGTQHACKQAYTAIYWQAKPQTNKHHTNENELKKRRSAARVCCFAHPMLVAHACSCSHRVVVVEWLFVLSETRLVILWLCLPACQASQTIPIGSRYSLLHRGETNSFPEGSCIHSHRFPVDPEGNETSVSVQELSILPGRLRWRFFFSLSLNFDMNSVGRWTKN